MDWISLQYNIYGPKLTSERFAGFFDKERHESRPGTNLCSLFVCVWVLSQILKNSIKMELSIQAGYHLLCKIPVCIRQGGIVKALLSPQGLI